MNFCLSYNQSPIYLSHADEIKLPWNQREKIQHYIDTYPNAVIILQHLFSGKPIDWDECEQIFDETDGTLVLCLGNVKDCLIAYEKDLPFYYGFPIYTYDELNSLLTLDPYYIIPGPPLFFNLPYLKNDLKASIRIFPNVNNLTNFPKVRYETGTWVRPEDLNYYSQFVDACEFVNIEIEAERALFRIYKNEETFIGPINLIVSGMDDCQADNDLINSEFIPVRTYCKQKCESGERNCTICKNLLHLADPEVLRPIYERMKNS